MNAMNFASGTVIGGLIVTSGFTNNINVMFGASVLLIMTAVVNILVEQYNKHNPV